MLTGSAARFQEMKHSLEQASLLQSDAESGDISIHRLIQAVVIDAIPSEEVASRFEDAVFVVNAAFPKEVSPASFYNHRNDLWSRAQECLPHVSNLKDLYTKLNVNLDPKSSFPRLLCDTCWYVLASHHIYRSSDH